MERLSFLAGGAPIIPERTPGEFTGCRSGAALVCPAYRWLGAVMGGSAALFTPSSAAPSRPFRRGRPSATPVFAEPPSRGGGIGARAALEWSCFNWMISAGLPRGRERSFPCFIQESAALLEGLAVPVTGAAPGNRVREGGSRFFTHPPSQS